MTQHHKSAHKNFYLGGMSKGFASKLPQRSLCLLTSFSLIGSGFVAASESSIYNITPTIENSQPKAAAQPAQPETIVSPTAQPKPDFSERQARLKKRLSSKSGYKAIQAIRDAKSQSENAQQGTHVSEADSLVKKLPEVPQTGKISEDTTTNTESNAKDDNNNNIDPTEDKNPDTVNYQSPSSVVVTEGSRGCKTILATGTCAKNTQNYPETKFPKASPNWLKKSATAKLPTVLPAKKSAWTPLRANKNQQKNIAENITNSDSKISRTRHNWRSKAVKNRTDTPSYTSHTKAAYHRPRFIPSPGEFSTTTVNPIAPPVGSLPAPVMEGNVAPRTSTVSYNFSLASVLPEVPYANTIAYRGGSGAGMIFPLAIAAPITSLFGWRVHPITGDIRFHTGTDLGAPTGTPILAAAKGQVETANWVGGYGLTVIINHSSAQQTLYGHMSQIFVQPGQWVEPGTVLGLVGNTGNSTGSHLHFEVRHLTQNGWVAVDPGVQLQGGLSQLIQSQGIAQVP